MVEEYGQKIIRMAVQYFPSPFLYGRVNMSNKTVLIVDDDVTLNKLVSEHLVTAGYRTLTAVDGKSGLQFIDEEDPDIVILDVMMPFMDGWEVCRRIRENTKIPIIMLTAKDEELDKLRGFHLGVDDYVTKPFSFAELTARVNAVLTRSGHEPKASKLIVSGDLEIDFEQRRVARNGDQVELTPTEFRLLKTIAQTTGRTVSTEELLREVWGPEYSGEVSHVKHYVWSLRKKIEADPGDPKHILTERGFGYRFE
jgi:two-component system KDP operon response regulator KdpE